MKTTTLKLEQQHLLLAAGGNLLVGCVGLTVAAFSSSQAILLDGLFNLTYLGTGLFTVKVASLVARGDDDRFPHGYAFFEPLANGIKGTLVLGVSVMALAGAVQALFSGGREIAAGPAIAYGVFATIACGIVALITRRGAQATGSPLVQADAENWIVNTAVSGCVLLAFAGIFLLRSMGLAALAPYVDPTVVIAVVVLSISVPVRMAWNALMMLLNRSPSVAVVQEVAEIVDACLAEFPVRERFIRVIQPGRQRWVLVHVVLSTDYRPNGLNTFDQLREQTHQALGQAHLATLVDVLFTADRQWGAPLSDGGSGGSNSSEPPD